MSTNLQDITLQSMDGTLVARNEMGHLTEPILFLDRQPVPSDAQGWDRVLVFVDGNNTLAVNPAVIELNEGNNYFQSLIIQSEKQWRIEGVVEGVIDLESSTGQLEGIGIARIDATKTPALTAQGSYSCFFDILLSNADGTQVRVPVSITVNVPLRVNNKNAGETLTINLNQANNYTELLTIIRDREWTLENVDMDTVNVSQTSGNGQILPDFTSTLTVTKSPHLMTTTATTTFQVVSLYQRINITVNITLTVTGEFVDPLPDEEGVIGTENLYLYL